MNDTRLLELMDAYFDLTLTNEERRELEEILRSSPDARHLFWEYAQIHSLVPELLQEAAEASESRQTESRAESSERRLSSRQPWIPVAAAACLLIGVGFWFLSTQRTVESPGDAIARGMRNPNEHLAAASPADRKNGLKLSIASVDGRIRVSYLKRTAGDAFHTGNKIYYTLERSTNAFERNWEPVSGHSDLPGDGVVDTHYELAQNNSAFYRIRARLQ